eukprot:4866955-Prymnesium_polylepis.1
MPAEIPQRYEIFVTTASQVMSAETDGGSEEQLTHKLNTTRRSREAWVSAGRFQPYAVSSIERFQPHAPSPVGRFQPYLVSSVGRFQPHVVSPVGRFQPHSVSCWTVSASRRVSCWTVSASRRISCWTVSPAETTPSSSSRRPTSYVSSATAPRRHCDAVHSQRSVNAPRQDPIEIPSGSRQNLTEIT